MAFVALDATSVALFALAKKRPGQHMRRAFQASSPKLPSPAGNSRAFFRPGRATGQPDGRRSPASPERDLVLSLTSPPDRPIHFPGTIAAASGLHSGKRIPSLRQATDESERAN